MTALIITAAFIAGLSIGYASARFLRKRFLAVLRQREYDRGWTDHSIAAAREAAQRRDSAGRFRAKPLEGAS